MHEPFSAGYYALHNREEVCTDHHSTDFDRVVENILTAERKHGKVFVKELAYCVVRQWDAFERHLDFFHRCTNVCLLRDPEESIASLTRQMKRVYGDECGEKRIGTAVGIEDLACLVSILSICGYVDSQDLVDRPKRVMNEMCNILNVPYDDKFLSWNSGSLADWKIWAVSGWHDDAIASTGFTNTESKNADVDRPIVQRLVQSNENAYETLLHRLKGIERLS